jgi:cytochrome c oxidase assembly factor CtaG/putative copper export protein
MTSRTPPPPVAPAPVAGGTPSPPPATRVRRWWWLLLVPPVAVVVTLTALVAAGDAPVAPALGLRDPGALTRWGLPVSRLLFDVTAVAVVGCLVTALLLPRAQFARSAAGALRAASWSAAAWALATVVLLLCTVSDTLGVPIATALATEGVGGYTWQLSQGRALLLVVAVGVVLAAYTRWTQSRAGVAVLLALAVGALLPLLFSGHSAVAADHDLATSSLVVHVLGASVWVGGLAGVLLLLRGSPGTLAEVLPRYSTLALFCFVAVAASGFLNAWVRTSGDLVLWAGSGYGALLVVKMLCLGALGAFGLRHRRRTVGAVVAGRPRAFLRLASGEVLVMAATVGVAVALSRTSYPAGATTDIPSHGLGHPTLGDDVQPFTAMRLLTEWRPEAISLLVIAVALGGYLAGVRALHRHGGIWPRRHLVAAVAAAVITLLATSGGLATYSTAAFSLQVSQFLVLLVVVPCLVTLSAPVTLLLRVRAAKAPGDTTDPVPPVLRTRLMAWLLDPLNVLIVATVMVFALYATPLYAASLRSAAVHLAVNLTVLSVGCLLWWSVLGVDPVPPPRPRSYRLWVVAGFTALLAGISLRVYLSEVVLGGDWFADLDWAWVTLPTDQRLGAMIMGSSVLVLSALMALLMRSQPEAVESGAETG